MARAMDTSPESTHICWHPATSALGVARGLRFPSPPPPFLASEPVFTPNLLGGRQTPSQRNGAVAERGTPLDGGPLGI